MVEHKLANKIILLKNECFWLMDFSRIILANHEGGFATLNAFWGAFFFLLAFFKCTKFFSYSLDILNLELISRQLFQPQTVYGNEKLETS